MKTIATGKKNNKVIDMTVRRRVDQLIDEYMARRENGEDVDTEQLVKNETADVKAEFYGDLQVLTPIINLRNINKLRKKDGDPSKG